jgi:hypothetical protein
MAKSREDSMSFFVQVTFDLKDSKSSDYLKIEKALSEMGLVRTIEKDGTIIELPHNTFAGVRNDPNEMSILKAVENDIHIFSKQEGIEGNVFISVAAKWEYNGFPFSSAVVRK